MSARKKTVSVKKLAEQISGLRQKVTQDMKSDDEKLKLTATAVALMDCTAERVGNDASAKDGHVGVTGFQKKHVSVTGNKVKLKYVGKSGVKHDKTVSNAKVVSARAKSCALSNPRNLPGDASEILGYICETNALSRKTKTIATTTNARYSNDVNASDSRVFKRW